MPPVLMRRADLKSGEILCTYCTARCCRYFAVPIDTPTTWKDFDNIRWYIMHGVTSVFVDKRVWYLIVNGVCKHLQPDNRCGAYETRPYICREYSTDNCEYDNNFLYDKYFESPEQVQEYAEAVLPPRKRRKKRTANLPILSAL